MNTQDKIILSADDLHKEHLISLISKIGKRIYAVKIHNLYDIYGSGIISVLKNAGVQKVWVDFKLHDIPNTVKLRAQSLASAGVDIITVHASGGLEMLKTAKEGFGSKKVYAVTALTSLGDAEISEIYGTSTAENLVLKLAKIVKESGVDGLVCSPKEVGVIRSNSEFNSLELVIPGIRSIGVNSDDQKRFDTPENTLRAGANFLVIGRQITKVENAEKALDLIQKEIENV